MVGWHREGDTYTRVWTAPDGNQHVICIARVVAGWSVVWQRGPGFTIHESGPFSTLEACVESLWSKLFEGTERRLQLQREEAVRVLRGDRS